MAFGSKKTENDAEAKTAETGEAPEATEATEPAAEAAAEGAASEAEGAKVSKKAKKQMKKEAEREAAEAAKKEAEEAKADASKKLNVRRAVVLTGVILASVIMIGSCLLPSLSAIVSGIQNAATTEAETTESDTTEAESEEAETTNSYMDDLDTRYEAIVEPLETKLESNAEDKATLINLANNYLTWGDSAQNYASTDEETEHVKELLNKAMGYYDSYLALDDASAAHVNRALCQYYLGDTSGAISALEEFCEGTSDYAPAWSNLGMMYEETGDTEKAKDAYNKALEVDPDDTCGVKSYASSQLSSLTEAETESAETTE